MNKKYAHEMLKRQIKSEQIQEIEGASDPFIALGTLVEKYDAKNICAILDKMSPLGGALIYAMIKSYTLTTKVDNVELYNEVCLLAEELKLEICEGVVKAHNKNILILVGRIGPQ
jgi:AICAR transformylase/IMP cyclohydrolase PurH